MADTTKIANNATKGKRVEVKLPRLSGQNAIQEEFFSVNGRTCRITRGEYVEVREEIEEVIRNGRNAEEYAMRYVDNLEKAKREKEKDLGL